MSEDVKGVFVRLPINADQRDIVLEIAGRDCLTAALLAIGTPVTGGELDVVGTIHIGDNGKPFFTAPEIYSTGGDVVRQSDAVAKLAEKDAEIARLRDENDGLRMAVDTQKGFLECLTGKDLKGLEA